MGNPDTSTAGPPANRPARQRMVAVIEDDCVGCNSCVDYCLVDCIEPAAPTPSATSRTVVAIREDECIGCFVCAKICEELAVNAIRLVSSEESVSIRARAQASHVSCVPSSAAMP